MINTRVKGYLLVSFAFFLNFNFQCQQWDKEANKSPKWQKIMSVALHISGGIHHMIMIWNFQICFLFFSVCIFSVVREVKEQKMAQNDKKFCLFHSLSQELCLLWLWFLLNMYKIMISPAICFIFQNSDFMVFFFLRRVRGKRAKSDT